ncbi:MAG: methyltransferase [Marmoricola sp.]
MSLDLPPLHEDLEFLSPLSTDRANRLVGWLTAGLGDGGTVLEIGCGWGELLLRVATAAPHVQVLGLDLDVGRVEEAQRRALARGLSERASFRPADASRTDARPHDAVICIGASQAWVLGEAVGEPLDYASALRALRARVRRGGRLLFGEAIWSHSPTTEATAALSGRTDEFISLPELVDLAEALGFAVAGIGEAAQDEWDAFEAGYCARYATWLATHPADHPDAGEVRDRAAGQRNGYLRGYRGVLGMAYLQLVAV